MPRNKTEPERMSEVADILAAAALILSVIYSNDSYDAWDLALSTLALILCGRRLLRVRMDDEGLWNSARIMARLGLALACFVLTYIALLIVYQSPAQSVQPMLAFDNQYNWEVFWVILAFIGLTMVDYLWHKRHIFLRKAHGDPPHTNPSTKA
jgi:hypothetical protein